MNIVAITQARMSSSRLPGKVLKEIHGKTLLQIHFERVSKSKLITHHILATSSKQTDDVIENFAIVNKIRFFRGDENNVLLRFIECLKLIDEIDYIVRLTADCPLIDAELIDDCIRMINNQKLDYVSNCVEPTFPDGLDVEVFTCNAIQKAYMEATLDSDKEHVTPYIWRNSNIKGGSLFKACTLKNKIDYSNIRLTVDEITDFELISELIKKIGSDKPWNKYVDEVKVERNITNQQLKRNEGYKISLTKD